MKKSIKNLKEAAERIRRAVQNKESIILYGDADLDGIASVVMLGEAIKNLGSGVSLVMFPNRENDGYGINMRALEFLKDMIPAASPVGEASLAPNGRALFITLDLGIANVKEVELAKKMGFDVMIIDHHEVLDKIPHADIVIDPKQKGDNSGTTFLCNAGITFKLCEEMLGDDFSDNVRNSFLELTALATISDMVPQTDDNKMFIEEGLRSLKNTFRPGLRAFLDILGKGEVVAGGYGKIISALNAGESEHFKHESYELLIEPSLVRCKEIAERLIAKTEHKQQVIQSIVKEVERRISQKPNELVIFEGDSAWKLTLAGPVASVIAQRYGKPTFIFKKGDTESCGSVRSLKEGEGSVDAMKTCKDILITYGGHAKASGFRLKNENLEKFKNCLNEYFLKNKV